MEFVASGIDFLTHVDTHLGLLFEQFGVLSYGFLFLILFCETGVVIAPFLPGDSLLFAVGTLGGSGILNVAVGWCVLFVGSLLGDSSNYWIGRTAGEKILAKKLKIISETHLEKTRRYFDTWGASTVAIGRFMPFVRTFAPFIAGLGRMPYPLFLRWSIIGSLCWVTLFVGLGYLFGNIPLIKNNFSIVVYLIIAISVLPTFLHFLRSRYQHRITEREETIL